MNRLGAFLATLGIVETWPDDPSTIFIDGPDDTRALDAQLSFYGLAIVHGHLVQTYATHPIEGPDALGRPTAGIPFEPRDLFSITIDFHRVGIGGGVNGADGFKDRSNVNAAAQGVRFQVMASSGVEFALLNTSERTFERSVVLGNSSADALVSELDVIEAGLDFTGLLGVRGDWARLESSVSISSFAGSGVERSTTTFPLRLDVPLGERVHAATVDAADASVAVAFQALGWQLSAGRETVRVSVLVEPIRHRWTDRREQLLSEAAAIIDRYGHPPPDWSDTYGFDLRDWAAYSRGDWTAHPPDSVTPESQAP
ncbi:MAG: hypothetical protein AAF668_13930 [Pseudomonadota bacterium]